MRLASESKPGGEAAASPSNGRPKPAASTRAPEGEVADERQDAPDADIAVRFDGVRLRGAVEWILALAPTVVLIVYWCSVGRVERVSILEDDAFYYLGVARSLAEGHGSTFAGSIMTNGYHPLWLALLVPVTWLVQDAELLVLAVLVVHGVLWAASVREIFRIGRAVGSWHGAAAAVAAYATLAVMTGHLAFNGMESALVLYLFLVLMRLGVTNGPDRSTASISAWASSWR